MWESLGLIVAYREAAREALEEDRIIGVFIVEQKMEQVIHTQKLNEVSSDEYDATLIDENSNIATGSLILSSISSAGL